MTVRRAILVSAGAVVAALFLASALALYRGIRRWSETSRGLEKRKREFAGYYAQDPFPSGQNTQREKENVETLNRWFGELLAAVRAGQIESTDHRPSAFVNLLGEKQGYLEASGTDIVPKKFSFAFDAYFAPAPPLPSPEHVPRLIEQLLIIEKLCLVLFREEVIAIKGIRRDEIERLGAAAGSGATFRYTGAGDVGTDASDPNAGVIGKDALFTKYRFTVEFVAREKTVWNVLNRLASHDLFVVVTSLRFTKSGRDVTLPEMPRGEAGAAEGAASRAPGKEGIPPEQRVVSGPDRESPLQVEMRLDVYKFRKE
jgi:hypothetical protein